MKPLCLICYLLYLTSGKAQDTSKQKYFQEIGWRVYLPINLEDIVRNDSISSASHPLLRIKIGQHNYFSAVITRNDPELLGLDKIYRQRNIQLYNFIAKQGDNVQILDTASSSETISNHLFAIFYMQNVYPKLKLGMKEYHFKSNLNIYTLNIDIFYSNEEVGREFFNIVRRSRFDF